jgi:hypothetical protein
MASARSIFSCCVSLAYATISLMARACAEPRITRPCARTHTSRHVRACVRKRAHHRNASCFASDGRVRVENLLEVVVQRLVVRRHQRDAHAETRAVLDDVAVGRRAQHTREVVEHVSAVVGVYDAEREQAATLRVLARLRARAALRRDVRRKQIERLHNTRRCQHMRMMRAPHTSHLRYVSAMNDAERRRRGELGPIRRLRHPLEIATDDKRSHSNAVHAPYAPQERVARGAGVHQRIGKHLRCALTSRRAITTRTRGYSRVHCGRSTSADRSPTWRCAAR